MMNHETKNKIKALLNGGMLVDTDHNMLELKGIMLGKDYEENIDWVDYTLSELDQLEVYVNPLQAKLDELQNTIDRLTADLVKANTPIKKGKYKHLSHAEVKEIEAIFLDNPDTDRNLIISTYDTSTTVVTNIATARHPKTSPSYKAYIMSSHESNMH